MRNAEAVNLVRVWLVVDLVLLLLAALHLVAKTQYTRDSKWSYALCPEGSCKIALEASVLVAVVVVVVAAVGGTGGGLLGVLDGDAVARCLSKQLR